ncbi:ABC transporter substrate-binding protein [Microbacterium resistens]
MTTDFIVVTPDDAVEFNDVYRNVTGSAGYIACNNLYSRLVLNEWSDIHPYPDLATHWECLDGARRWRFHLNQAARWHDGMPLTAHDVHYTHTHAIANGYTGGRMLKDVAAIEIVNDHTLDYHLKGPNSGFLVMLGNFVWTHILPAHLYEGTDWATNPHNLDPVGSGPFRFAEWIPGDRIVMEAVKDHWGPRPEIDRLILKIVPDRDECVRMLARGEAHYFPQDTLTKDRLPLLEGATAGIELMLDRGPGQALLDFNQAQDRWKDVRARRAIAQAVDRSEIDALGDPGISQAWDHYLLASTDWAFNAEAKAPAHDLAGAEELLDEVGMTRGADGRRGHLRLYYMDTFDGHRPLARIVADQLDRVGFDVTWSGLSSVDWANTITRDRDFDLIIIGGSMTPDPEIMSTKYSTGGDNNVGGHANPEVDAAFQRAREALTIPERGEHYRELQTVLARDVEYVPLFWYGTYFARSTDFFGWSDQVAYTVPWWHWGRIRPVATADRVAAG